MAILDCPCGKKLRVGEGLEGKKVRCPGCKTIHAVPTAAPAPPESPKPPTRGRVDCPGCGQPVRVGLLNRRRFLRCPSCGSKVPVPVTQAPKPEIEPAAELAGAENLDGLGRMSGVVALLTAGLCGVAIFLPLGPKGGYLWEIFNELSSSKQDIPMALWIILFFPAIGAIVGVIAWKMSDPFARGVTLMAFGALPQVISGTEAGRGSAQIVWMILGSFFLLVLSSAGGAAARGKIESVKIRGALIALAAGSVAMATVWLYGLVERSNEIARLNVLQREPSVAVFVLPGLVILGGSVVALGVALGNETTQALGTLATIVAVVALGSMPFFAAGDGPTADAAGYLANQAIRSMGPMLLLYAGSLSLMGRIFYVKPSAA